MKGSLAVCERDLRKFARQPFVVLFTIIGPLLTLILLGGTYGGAITHAPIAIVRESHGPFSSMFEEILRNQQSCQFGGINCANSFQLIDVPDVDAAEQMLRGGLVKAVILLPLGFDRSLGANTKVTVTVSLDNTDPLSATAIGSELVQASNQLSSLVQIAPVGSSGITVDLANVYRNTLYIDFMSPGTFVQSIMFVSIIAGGIQLVEDKEKGIIEGYLVTPLKKHEIVLGILLSGVIKALFSSVVLFALAVVAIGVRPQVSVMGVTLIVATLFLTSLGIIAMMTAYAVRASSADLYRVTIFPINLTLYYTSGAVYPINGFPTWMRDISIVNPETYAVHALRLLMFKGAELQGVVGDFAFLAVFTGLMLGLATIAFKRGL